MGTFNGFWAFELEHLGAAEVIGVDLLDPREWDWPVGLDPATVSAIGDRLAGGLGFEIARSALGSSVTRIDRSVYDLSEQDLG